MSELEQAIIRAIEEKKILVAPTLKSFAAVFGVKPVQLYTIAKTPIPDVIYDSRLINWGAVEKYCRRRFDTDAGIANFDDVVNKAIICEQDTKLTDRRVKKDVEVLLLNGKEVPVRKVLVSVGQIVELKNDVTVYHIVYLTDTNIILQLNDTSELTCLSNWSLNNRIKSVT